MNAQDKEATERSLDEIRDTAAQASEPVREAIASVLSVLLGSFLLTLGTGALLLTVVSYFLLTGIQAGIFGTIGIIFTFFPYFIYGILWLNKYML
jgi:hypothetical protein